MGNDETPDFILRKLIEDPDINVSQVARKTLDEIEDFYRDDVPI